MTSLGGLPVLETVKQGYGFVWEHKFKLLKLVFLPFLLFAFFKIYLDYDSALSQDFLGLGAEASKPAQFFVLATFSSMKGILFAVVLTVFSVTWHRVFLIQAETQTITTLFNWQKRHLKFLIVAIVFALVGYVFTLPLAYLIKPLVGFFLNTPEASNSYLVVIVSGLMLKFVWLSLGALVSARWCLMFPAIAVDDFMTFQKGWRFTTGHGLRITGVLILSTIPIKLLSDFVLIYGFPKLVPLGGQFVVGLTSLLFEYLSYFLILALGVSTLSVAYQNLRNRKAETA